MMLTKEIEAAMDDSVLCWLATSSANNMPNVSPKEIFCYFEDDTIIVANIASPQTVKNIRANKNVCISFIDILKQKGFQLKGAAEIIEKSATDFSKMEKMLLHLTEGKFPFATITKITITSSKPIIAPKYLLYPNTTEEQQIESAKKSYGL
ncbi:pyridoxamine 5'-phosphate oxidase family protein [Maribacter sp. Hel_I_7]|uniref:pyridoxamine 5'-phosphate oxidase family protein n=1 Tax=Maribacter sp. Hel_I_7 TaxID=1249997 RepID=UPI0009DCE13E|nr:pyridoxamine 5'-phosphate oxidase family protein [Maribacter sp. Hel_I_7]|tara:strand:+ start:550 stop:1002 length:453 start_codon:yes stop_codon:yes gene_type:complete